MATRQATIRKELEAQAARLRAELAELARGSRPSGIGQRPIDGGDVVDQASASANREQSRFRVAMLDQRLEQVINALQRLDDGTYGTCEVCGEKISDDRLEVLPTATLCVTDREGLEHGVGGGARPQPVSAVGAGQGGRRHG
ncbi:MAG: TraR/DksA C4-type zinc finger protein [Proteobacteria bacterium]|nr:TraR/DksA C4-type zinc finger protein [Pseudomonadota bacterium]